MGSPNEGREEISVRLGLRQAVNVVTVISKFRVNS